MSDFDIYKVEIMTYQVIYEMKTQNYDILSHTDTFVR